MFHKRTLAQRAYVDSELGVPYDLMRAGSALENRYVYDATARELREMAERGLIVIEDEHQVPDGADTLFDRLRFIRMR